MRILLVEDDESIGNAIKQALNDASYAVNWVKDGITALSSLNTEEYSLVLLDLGLPGKNGLEVLHELRKTKSLPVIVITARDAVEDRIQGLDLGADDYLVKPFSIDELHARMRAVVRRNHGVATPILSNSLLELDPATREVSRDGESFPLSAREYALLQTLMLRPGTIFSRDNLEESIYGWNEEVASNAIEFIIHALRKKLGKDAIKNIRGMGWMVSK
ncbi:response regulator transcription factor [Cocleimonas flava]|jgi:two-component system OmpR family response regulator|uniref:Winged helix family two component transcriptional regulator n=1 Tax=Cocleimonas flava TaxID=634765 RepID=A0A4R1F3T8_9GAMM|nr:MULTISPECIES: response regulator transcription factor [Cocleimonas]MEB8431913.1 response regulator transcription factor [Cocleimonas sp. KMM 6892]MEC4715001.1 response regulator transcription factor [Cocleimonas sp. KMM 6895]MEC4744185.1 response regulator transcription factor [Cocleimonas sp. KMM 6896]TCJ87224.1 winged helix family two component transcriptional regulator [Cocleimonas flava]